MTNVINTQIIMKNDDCYWINSETNELLLMSSKFSKYGSEYDRVIYYFDDFGFSNYLVRVDTSVSKDYKESIIGIAEVNGKYLIQLNNCGDVFQLKTKQIIKNPIKMEV